MGTGTSAKGLTGVDWYPSRMEGKTIMFQIWYIQVLRRLASLNEEFQNTLINDRKIGSAEKASGGYIWAIVEGLFGFNFDSDNKAVASIHPNFPDEWKNTDISVIVRGTKPGRNAELKPVGYFFILNSYLFFFQTSNKTVCNTSVVCTELNRIVPFEF